MGLPKSSELILMKKPGRSGWFVVRAREPLVAVLLALGCGSGAASDGDASARDTAQADAPEVQLLPTTPVSPCQWRGQQDTWIAEQGMTWMRYSCREACAGAWTTCAAPVSARDQHAQEPKLELPFVSDDMAGRLRLSDRSGPTITIHSGGPGTYYLAEGSVLTVPSGALISALESHAPQFFRVIEVKWEGGLFGQGVNTPKSEQPLDTRASVGRSASLIRWIKANLAGGEGLATVGCSGGSVQSLGATLWYEGVDQDLAYQLVSSGPPASWDVNTWCGGTPVTEGVCENDPTTSCTANAACGDAKNRCAFEVASDSNIAHTLRLLVDLQHGTPNTCVGKQYSTLFQADSFAFTPSRFRVGHRVDMVVAEGCNLAEGCNPAQHSIDDTQEGITGQMGRLFRAMTAAGADVVWTDLHNYGHCDAVLQPELVPDTVAKVAAGMR